MLDLQTQLIPNPGEQLQHGLLFCPVFAVFAFFAVYNSLPEVGITSGLTLPDISMDT